MLRDPAEEYTRELVAAVPDESVVRAPWHPPRPHEKVTAKELS